MLHSLNSQMENSQNSLDIQINSLATSTSVDNVLRALRDMRLEAANDRNTQLDIIRKDIGNQMGCFDTKSSERVLRSIELLNSRIEDHFARSRISPAQNTALPSPVLRPCMPVDPGLLCHDHNAMQRVEEQLATHTQLLQLLTERDLRPQSSGSMLHENDNGMIRDCQRTIKQSIEVMLSLFKAGVNALLLKLWIALPFVQHILRALRAPPLLVSVPIADFILFEDALGRIAHLPYLHFRHHAVFMARLRCEFKNVPGEKKVLLEQFRIFSQKHCNNFLTEDNWEHAVEPGSKIAMSILLNSHGSKGDICPRCGTIKTEMDAADLSKWYVSSLMNKLMLTSRSTVCELNWALQKSRPILTSLSTERFNEVISAPTLAQDVFEVAENESSSSSTSSPDPPEVTVPLVDNDDIKSFKMVHIQLLNERADREAISLTPRFLETTFPFWESRSYQPASYERLTVDSALMEIIQSLHLYGPNRSGSIYICWYEGSPQILRIGRTTRNVEQRLLHWRNKCRVQYISDPYLYNGTAMETSFVAHVERLIHVELKNYRMDVFCEGCGKTHTELFRVSKEPVLKVFQKWKDWVAREPYMSTGNGRWMLKPSFLAHAREICRPLAMKE
jgi:hypothetical protein